MMIDLYTTLTAKLILKSSMVIKKLLFLETSAIQFHKHVFRKIRARKQPKTFEKIVNKSDTTVENINQEMLVKIAKRHYLKDKETK